jgi:ABC-2 type transport system ATP-binding protein
MLKLTDLHKRFGSVVAVDGLSLEVQPGEVLGLLGPNGAGKTTTINMALGQLRPDSGSVDVAGRGSPTRAEVRRLIGLAPQDLALYDELTAEANLRFFGQLYDLRGRALAARVDELLEFVGLTERRKSRVGTFSGGMQRRLNLAVGLLHRPALILLDEATVGVDPQSRNAIFELVQALQADGATIIYTTHYMEEAQRLCDRVAIIDHGKLLALDTVDGLIREHGGPGHIVIERAEDTQRVETRDPKPTLLAALEDPQVLSVRVERPDLESVFLQLTGRRLRD